MAVIGDLTTVSYSTTQGGSYTGLTHVTDIEQPHATVPPVEVTEMLDTSAKMLPDNCSKQESHKFTMNFNKTDLAAMITNRDAYTILWWKHTLKDGSLYAGPAFIGGVSGPIPRKGAVTHDVMLEPTALWTFTAAS